MNRCYSESTPSFQFHIQRVRCRHVTMFFSLFLQQAAAKAALQAANSIIPNFGLSPAKTMETEGGPNHVLHASIDNCIIPVTIEALHKVFSPFGTVLKIVTFTRNGKLQHLWNCNFINFTVTAFCYLHFCVPWILFSFSYSFYYRSISHWNQCPVYIVWNFCQRIHF